MKLKDLNYKNVSVGAKNGTNWLYIGKYDYEEIKRVFKEYYEHAKYIRSLKEKRIAKLFEKLQEEERDEVKALLKSEINATIKAEEELSAYIENYKPVEEREIVETYPRRTEKNMYNVLVEGSERGAYWTLNEYRMAQKKKAG